MTMPRRPGDQSHGPSVMITAFQTGSDTDTSW